MQVLSEGQYVKHELYGYGVVTESDSERTSIDFDGVGMKKFVTTLMTAELVGEAPEKPSKSKRRSRKSVAKAVAAAARAASRS